MAARHYFLDLRDGKVGIPLHHRGKHIDEVVQRLASGNILLCLRQLAVHVRQVLCQVLFDAEIVGVLGGGNLIEGWALRPD